MTKSIKAVLLSALVFPGAGHFFLKRHILGIILTSATIASLYFLISGVVEKALKITDKIQRGEVLPDVAAITDLISAQPTGSEIQVITIASYVLMIAWVIGIVDSYRIGRIQDKRKAPNN
jgi:hypothetical protein